MPKAEFTADFTYVRPEGGEVTYRAGATLILNEATVAAADAAGALCVDAPDIEPAPKASKKKAQAEPGAAAELPAEA